MLPGQAGILLVSGGELGNQADHLHIDCDFERWQGLAKRAFHIYLQKRQKGPKLKISNIHLNYSWAESSTSSTTNYSTRTTSFPSGAKCSPQAFSALLLGGSSANALPIMRTTINSSPNSMAETPKSTIYSIPKKNHCFSCTILLAITQLLFLGSRSFKVQRNSTRITTSWWSIAAITTSTAAISIFQCILLNKSQPYTILIEPRLSRNEAFNFKQYKNDFSNEGIEGFLYNKEK